MSEPVSPAHPVRLSPEPAGLMRVLRFAGVGVIGFGVDAAVTLTLAGLGFGPYGGRAAAIAVAMAVTYGLNRGLTFRGAGARGVGGIAAETLRYAAVAIGAALFNWAVYAGALIAAPGLPILVALVIGSGAAMAASYVGYSRFAFRPGVSPAAPPSADADRSERG